MSDANMTKKQLRMARIIEIVKTRGPSYDELIAILEVEIGLSKRSAKDYVQTLQTINILSLEEKTGKVEVVNNGK